MKIGDRVCFHGGEGVVVAIESDEWGPYLSVNCGDYFESVDYDECSPAPRTPPAPTGEQ